MLRCVAAVSCAFLANVLVSTAHAADCPGNPDALGTSRTLVIDPTEHRRLGSMQYPETLPLGPKEVVITFDDGPLPPYTKQILGMLAAECVKVTYFLVGSMAHAYPETVRELFEAGHTIGTHSQTHPLTFHRMPIERAQQEIEGGIASVATALGDPSEVAPFFRIPGLLRADPVEAYLASRSLVTWSADVDADDWFHGISSAEIAKRAVSRLEAAGRGILLLHDIHPKTVAAFPTILHELKARGFHVVHVMPATPDLPKTATDPQLWATHKAEKLLWPQIADLGIVVLPVSALPNSPVSRPTGAKPVGTVGAGNDEVQGTIVRLSSHSAWPHGEGAALPVNTDELPEPSQQSLESPDSPAYMLTPKRFSHPAPDPTPTKHARYVKHPAAKRAKPARVAANSLFSYP
ncbi:MAG: polysaccharide deacetylase family protein [Xanthobacteraceae bacterium]